MRTAPLALALLLCACQSKHSLQVEVRPYTVPCTKNSTKQCLEVRELPDGSWNVLKSDIRGFQYEPGNKYVLKVHDLTREAPCSPTDWQLLSVIEKNPMNVTAVNPENWHPC